MNEYSSEMRGLPMLDEFSFKVLELKNGFLIQKVRHILKYISQDNFINHQPLISEECDSNVIDRDRKMFLTHK